MITIRPAAAADQPAINRVIRESQINYIGLKWPNFLLAVDEASGAVVGTGQIKRHRDGSYELASIATRPGYRGQGIAHQIITQLLARHSGALYLTCMENRESLYQEFGFRAIDSIEMPPYFKRLEKLARAFLHVSGDGRKLLVMKRDGLENAHGA